MSERFASAQRASGSASIPSGRSLYRTSDSSASRQSSSCLGVQRRWSPSVFQYWRQSFVLPRRMLPEISSRTSIVSAARSAALAGCRLSRANRAASMSG